MIRLKFDNRNQPIKDEENKSRKSRSGGLEMIDFYKRPDTVNGCHSYGDLEDVFSLWYTKIRFFNQTIL